MRAVSCFGGLLILASVSLATDTPLDRLQLDLGGGTAMELVRVEHGEFQMGANDGNSDESPVHGVRLTHGFWIGVHEVTQAQWERVMGGNPSFFRGPTRPVENVSWNDCQRFLKQLNRALETQLPEGTAARLPTEAEWVYACRAGTRTMFWFGDDPADLMKYGNFADAAETNDLAWRSTEWRDGFSGTAPVGSFPPNPWGLYDMHGNVWEWCSDWYGSYPSDTVVDPVGPGDGRRRVLRGGGWGVTAEDCRSSNRYRFKPDVTGANVGFRIVIAPKTR